MAAPRIAGFTDFRPVGTGGFGEVYRAIETALQRPVAVKVWKASGAPKGARQRFKSEGVALAKLSRHRHVIAVYRAGETDEGWPYLVLEWAPGGTLRDRLARNVLGWRDSAVVGGKLASALVAAHAQRMVHRDVKPTNVLFDAEGEPLLADFGIVRFLDATPTGQHPFSLAYAAPEQFTSGDATGQTDVYSLGATLYHAVTGSPPFVPTDGIDVAALAHRILHHTVELGPLAKAGLPAPLIDLLGAMLSREPAQRPTPEQVVQALDTITGSPGDTRVDPARAETVRLPRPPPTRPEPPRQRPASPPPPQQPRKQPQRRATPPARPRPPAVAPGTPIDVERANALLDHVADDAERERVSELLAATARGSLTDLWNLWGVAVELRANAIADELLHAAADRGYGAALFVIAERHEQAGRIAEAIDLYEQARAAGYTRAVRRLRRLQEQQRLAGGLDVPPGTDVRTLRRMREQQRREDDDR